LALGFDMQKDSGTVESEASVAEIDYEAEKRLVRKIDRHIVPVIMLLYLLSFLDRSPVFLNPPTKRHAHYHFLGSILAMHVSMDWRRTWD